MEIKKTRQTPIVNVNNLVIGQTGYDEALDIEIEPFMDLDFKSKAEILELRTEAVKKYPQLLKVDYQPDDKIFGRLEDGAPWWGTLGGVYYGRGEKSIEGPSEQSASILNPYLLIVPQFREVWSQSRLSVTDIGNNMHSEYCHAKSLTWYPGESKVESAYDDLCMEHMPGNTIDLIAYNARDFGLNYIYVSYENSINVSKVKAPVTAYKIPQFLHRGQSCGYPGGCNNISPTTPPIDNIEITGWPAKIVIWLWYNEPKTIEKIPDMTFIMRFE